MPGPTDVSKTARRSDGAADESENTRGPRVAHVLFKLRDMSNLLWNTDVRYRVKKILPLVRMLS